MRRPDRLDLASDNILRGVDHVDRGEKGCILAHLGHASGLDIPPHTAWFSAVFFRRVMLPTWQVPEKYHWRLRFLVESTIESLEWALLQDMQTYLGESRGTLIRLGIFLTVDGVPPAPVLHYGDEPLDPPIRRKARVLPFPTKS